MEGNEPGWRGRRADHWMIQAGLRYEDGREEDDSDDPEGLGDADDEWMVMSEVRRGFGPDWRNWLAARVMAGGGDLGAIGVVAGGHRFCGSPDGDGIELIPFAAFATSDFINRDFGVTRSQSENSGFPATDLDGGFRSVGISAIGRWSGGRRWQVGIEAGCGRYSEDISDSPIARDDYEAEAGFTVLYRFGSAVRPGG